MKIIIAFWIVAIILVIAAMIILLQPKRQIASPLEIGPKPKPVPLVVMPVKHLSPSPTP